MNEHDKQGEIEPAGAGVVARSVLNVVRELIGAEKWDPVMFCAALVNEAAHDDSADPMEFLRELAVLYIEARADEGYEEAIEWQKEIEQQRARDEALPYPVRHLSIVRDEGDRDGDD